MAWRAVMPLFLAMCRDLHVSSGVVFGTLLVGYLETAGFHLAIVMDYYRGRVEILLENWDVVDGGDFRYYVD